MQKADPGEHYSLKQLRWNALVFTGGKGVNAALNFALLVMIASLLTRADFALYAWLVAFVEFTASISRLGVNAIVNRYAPQLHASCQTRALRRLVLATTGLRMASILIVALICYLGGGFILDLLDKPEWLAAFRIYIIVQILFALIVFLRDMVFQALIQQSHAQVNTTLRHALFLIGLYVLLVQEGSLSIMAVIGVEIAATAVTALAALLQLAMVLRRLPPDAGASDAHLPSWRAMITFAANSYVTEMLRLLGSGYALMTAAPQMLTTAALAPFGFCQTLFGQLYRFIPGHLFSGLLRPKIIADYTRDKSLAQLNRKTVVVLKLSNYALALGLAVFAVHGEFVLDLISRGKYGDEYLLMLTFLVIMFIENYRFVMVELCATIEKTAIPRKASWVIPLVVPLAFVLVQLDLGYYGLTMAIIICELVYLALILRQLHQDGQSIDLDSGRQIRMVPAALAAAALGLLLQQVLAGLIGLIIGSAAISAVFVLTAKLLGTMSESERQSIDRLIGRKTWIF